MAKKKVAALRTMAVNEQGLWRGGVKHTRAPQDFRLDQLNKEQIEQIRAEHGKLLLVQDVEIDVEEADKKV